MTAFQFDELMPVSCLDHALVIALSAGFEHILGAYIDVIILRGVFGQLIFMQDRREESHRMDTIRSEIGYIRSDARPVTQTSYRAISGHCVGRIHHRHQFTDRVFYLVLSADTTVAEEIAAEVLTAGMHFVGPFIAIGHDQYHRRTETLCYLGSEGVQGVPFLLPRTFVTVDAVYQIQDRKRTFPLRYIDFNIPT